MEHIHQDELEMERQILELIRKEAKPKDEKPVKDDRKMENS